jgi:hypothetical protein
MSTPTAAETTRALFAAAEAARAEHHRRVDAFRAHIHALGYTSVDLQETFGFSRQAADRHIKAAARHAAAPPGGRGTRTRIAVLAVTPTEDAA